MNIGIRAHDVPANNITDLAIELEKLGARNIQLALLKSIQDIDLKPGSFSPGLARFFREELEKHDVHISVLGCYINPVHPDPKVRAAEIAKFREHIKYAKYLGADMIGTETGSVNANWSYSPDNAGEENYQDFLSVMRSLAEYAASLGVMLGIEGVWVHTINTPERMKRFLDDINMPNVSVILDPVNYLNKENYKNQHEIVAKCFELFADRMAAIHIKDFTVEETYLKTTRPMDGEFDFAFLFDLIKKHKPHIDLLLEEQKAETYQKTKEQLLAL